jgi:hypothetical protein
MFLNKHDTVGKAVQRAVFYPKYMTTPLAIFNISSGAFDYMVVTAFGVRVLLKLTHG